MATKNQKSKDRLVANGIIVGMVLPLLLGIFWIQKKT